MGWMDCIIFVIAADCFRHYQLLHLQLGKFIHRILL